MAKRLESTDTGPWRAYLVIRIESHDGDQVYHRAIPSENYISEFEKLAPARVICVAKYACQSEELALKLFDMEFINRQLDGTGYQATRNYYTDRIFILDEDGDSVFDLDPEFNPRSIVEAVDVYRAGIEAGERKKAAQIRAALDVV